jgi:hypothetical protein
MGAWTHHADDDGGVAVQQHDGPAVAWAFVDVMHAPVGRVEPARLVWPRARERSVDGCQRTVSRAGGAH